MELTEGSARMDFALVTLCWSGLRRICRDQRRITTMSDAYKLSCLAQYAQSASSGIGTCYGVGGEKVLHEK